jgi:hypothetical protein
MHGALETVEEMAPARQNNLEDFVVSVLADFTSGHFRPPPRRERSNRGNHVATPGT